MRSPFWAAWVSKAATCSDTRWAEWLRSKWCWIDRRCFGEYLVGTAPRGGEDIMHLEKPSLARYLNDPNNHGYAVLLKIFFPPTSTGARQL